MQQQQFAWVAEFDKKLTDGLGDARPLPRRGELARQSVIVLDQVADLLGWGKRWIRHELHNRGGFCLVGALQAVRAHHAARDMAGIYLASAIAEYTGKRSTIVEFNDGRGSFDDIGRVISVARHRAQAVVDLYAFADDPTTSAAHAVDARSARRRYRMPA
jgi:hypothetical protein